MTGLLYVWSGRSFAHRATCRTCRQPFRMHIRFDTGKRIPLRLEATPLSTETQADTGKRFDVYAWSDVHRCPRKQD